MVGKNVLITGVGRGIGLETCREFLKDKRIGKVVGTTRNPEQHPLSGEDRLTLIHSEFSLEEGVKRMISKITDQLDSIDYIVLNAGVLVNKPLREQEWKDFSKTFTINAIAQPFMVGGLLDYMNKGAHVVTIGSVGGMTGTSKFPGLSTYSPSKAAIAVWSEVMAVEEEDYRFNTLALGAVNTEMLAEAFPGYEAAIGPNDIATYIKDFTIEGGKYFNGKTLPVSVTNP